MQQEPSPPRPHDPSPEDFDSLMASKGWVQFRGVLPAAQVAVMKNDLDRLYDLCREVQTRNGVAANMEGTAHHLVGYGTSLDRMIEAFPLQAWIDRYFAGKYILLNFGASLNPPGSRAYLAKPHRDVRAFSRDLRLSLNMLVLLDSFTAQSGGTMVLSGSHATEAMPSSEEFERSAEQIVGEPGDIVLFDSLLVHSAAPNRGEARRRALTLCLGRPWMKPQIDFPRFIPPERHAALSATERQLYGFDARVAVSLDEYYQPAERWTFKADQR